MKILREKQVVRLVEVTQDELDCKVTITRFVNNEPVTRVYFPFMWKETAITNIVNRNAPRMEIIDGEIKVSVNVTKTVYYRA